MDSSALTPEQRDQLIALVSRRAAKLDDRALIELERLTRRPESLWGYVPASPPDAAGGDGAPDEAAPLSESEPAPAQSEALPAQGPAVLLRPRERTFTRRELILSLAAFTTVSAVGGTSYGLGRRHVQKDYTELGRRVHALAGQGAATAAAAREIRAEALACIDRYPSTRTALDQWRQALGYLQAYHRGMQLAEDGLQTLIRFLRTVASFSKPSLELLAGLVSLELGDLSAFSEALQAASDLLDFLDPALRAAEEAQAQVDPWFSGADGDIKTALLHPLEDAFCPDVTALGEACEALQAEWSVGLET